MSKYQILACVMVRNNHFCNFWSLLKMNCSVHTSLFVSTRTEQIDLRLFGHSCFLDFLCLLRDTNSLQAMQMKTRSACCTSLKMIDSLPLLWIVWKSSSL